MTKEGLLGYRGGNNSGGVYQIQLGAFRKMFYQDCEHDPRIEAFIAKVAEISDDAIVQIIQSNSGLDIGLLVNADGELLRFA